MHKKYYPAYAWQEIVLKDLSKKRGKLMPDDQIAIHKMIVHKTDHIVYDEPQLSDMESPIPEEVSSFLRQHIIFNREHKYTRTAQFLDAPDAELILKDICDELLSNTDNFILQSKIIATHLFNNIKKNKRISPGDLIICTFSEIGNDSKWLALLKLDPEDGFVGEREEVNGQIRIVLRRVKDVLPTGELQKCAFIVPNNMRESLGYDLKVLDQQSSRYAARQLVASFFINDFLQCKVGLNQADKTINFVYLSRDWVNKKDWPAEDKERFKNYVSEVINNNIVDTASVAQAVIASQEDQDDYVEYIKENGLDELAFEPDPEERRKLIQYVWFEGDYGLTIKIKKDAIGPGNTLEYRKDESTNQWLITIRTTIWEDKIRRGR